MLTRLRTGAGSVGNEPHAEHYRRMRSANPLPAGELDLGLTALHVGREMAAALRTNYPDAMAPVMEALGIDRLGRLAMRPVHTHPEMNGWRWELRAGATVVAAGYGGMVGKPRYGFTDQLDAMVVEV
jgi:hypothetical protein